MFDDFIERTSQRRFATKADTDPLSFRESVAYYLMKMEAMARKLKHEIRAQIAILAARVYWWAVE